MTVSLPFALWHQPVQEYNELITAVPASAFVRLLNELRMGRASQEAIDTFKGLSRKVTYEDGVEPTCLYARRNQVLYENTRRLKQLQGVNVTYRASDVSGKSGEAPNKDLYPQEKDLRPFLDKVSSLLSAPPAMADLDSCTARSSGEHNRPESGSTSNARQGMVVGKSRFGLLLTGDRSLESPNRGSRQWLNRTDHRLC